MIDNDYNYPWHRTYCAREYAMLWLTVAYAADTDTKPIRPELASILHEEDRHGTRLVATDSRILLHGNVGHETIGGEWEYEIGPGEHHRAMVDDANGHVRKLLKFVITDTKNSDREENPLTIEVIRTRLESELFEWDYYKYTYGPLVVCAPIVPGHFPPWEKLKNESLAGGDEPAISYGVGPAHAKFAAAVDGHIGKIFTPARGAFAVGCEISLSPDWKVRGVFTRLAEDVAQERNEETVTDVRIIPLIELESSSPHDPPSNPPAAPDGPLKAFDPETGEIITQVDGQTTIDDALNDFDDTDFDIETAFAAGPPWPADDPEQQLFNDIIEYVASIEVGNVTVAAVQRKFKLSFNKSAALFLKLVDAGVIEKQGDKHVVVARKP
jgi:hypothetical protein